MPDYIVVKIGGSMACRSELMKRNKFMDLFEKVKVKAHFPFKFYVAYFTWNVIQVSHGHINYMNHRKM